MFNYTVLCMNINILIYNSYNLIRNELKICTIVKKEKNTEKCTSVAPMMDTYIFERNVELMSYIIHLN